MFLPRRLFIYVERELMPLLRHYAFCLFSPLVAAARHPPAHDAAMRDAYVAFITLF